MNEVYLSHGTLYHYPLMPFFKIASESGFDGVEIIVGRNRELSDISYMKHLAGRFSIPVRVLHSPFNSWKSDFLPGHQPGKLDFTVNMAKGVGAKVVVAHTALSNEMPYKKWLENNLSDFQKECEPIKIAVENMPKKYVMFGAAGRKLFDFMREAKISYKFRRFMVYDIAAHTRKEDRLFPCPLDDEAHSLNTFESLNRFKYITIDTTHLGTWKCDPADFVAGITAGIAHVHLSNYKTSKEHRLPNDGLIDFTGFFKKLKEKSYDGGITLEADPDSFNNHRSFAETKKQLLENLNFIKKMIKNA